MVDLILAVNDPQRWHEANISRNPSHYSMLRWLGSGTVASIQRDYGTKMYFNTLVPFEHTTIKYGVVSTPALLADLYDWELLYAAGRLHKPCKIIKLSSDENLSTAIRLNLQSAVHTALLMLPAQFSDKQLYTRIAVLSYVGDFRMWIGEDRNKIDNIVDAQLVHFRRLYRPILLDLSDYVEVNEENGEGRQDVSPSARLYHLSMLPRELQERLTRRWNRDGRHRDVEDVLRAAACDPYSEDLLLQSLGDIVKLRSVSQAMKGIITAGVAKSVRYSGRKLVKMWRSMRLKRH